MSAITVQASCSCYIQSTAHQRHVRLISYVDRKLRVAMQLSANLFTYNDDIIKLESHALLDHDVDLNYARYMITFISIELDGIYAYTLYVTSYTQLYSQLQLKSLDACRNVHAADYYSFTQLASYYLAISYMHLKEISLHSFTRCSQLMHVQLVV